MGGLEGFPGAGPYVASKHGLVDVMKTLARELASHSIRVNSIHPTQVDTAMIMNEATRKRFAPDLEHPMLEDLEPLSMAKNSLPVAWTEPRDIDNALLFLSSDEARYITGIALPGDAGALLK